MGDSAHTYDSDHSAGSAPVSQVERAQLCDLFDVVGPSAHTLSGDWDTHHLVAHLAAREGTPLGFLKVVRPKVGEEAVNELVAEHDYSTLVNQIRGGPPRLSVFGTEFTDRQANTLEFFIHHEDVHRAMPEWNARQLPGWVEDEIWSRLKFFARGLMRKAPVGVRLERSGSGESTVPTRGKSESAIIKGKPSELALFAYGRGTVAAVDFSGPPESIELVQQATFGF
ncbi:MAG: TIGR03085 family metal-binding protein [Nocardioidaceae bacterium]